MDFEVAGNGRADDWEEVILTKLRQQSEFLQLVLCGILEFGKTKLDTPLRAMPRTLSLVRCKKTYRDAYS